MRKQLLKSVILLAISAMLNNVLLAQTKTASLKVSGGITHQKITGFGGFVNSPQFGYNHMTDAEIRKLWGKDSEAGYNIMRIYLPIGEANWSQSLNTAKLAKSLGLIVFASPWSMPTEWKTQNIVGSRYNDGTGWKDVYLKEEHYEDYARYLNNYVTYLRNNGVELDAISLQNEPDYQVDYAGCIWTPTQMSKFLREYSHLIDCKIIAPETVGISDSYANAFLAPNVLDKFEIFGGHQYGNVQTGFQALQAQGKDVWMTEFLINWNSEGTSRNFNWNIDAFDFAKKLNDALLANVNAWIHYAAKRYYGMMGDGTAGTTTGEITKRGHILSHYAKYVTGATRVENAWKDNSNALSGSTYMSVTGDSTIVVVINPSADSYSLTVDLPFYSQSGKGIVTTATTNMAESAITLAEETVRPLVNVSASSITTFIFTKSKEREVSQMVGTPVHYDKIEEQTPTNSAFGTAYQMSGKTLVLKNDMPLIGTSTDNTNGYLRLDEKFNYLVMHVKNLSSTLSYSSANTTLYYINSAGSVRSHNYGAINFDKRTDFNWVLDISPNTLTDGCIGIIGLRNGNFSSVLTFTFGDVYFAVDNEKGYKFSEVYSGGDSNLMDAFEDITYTSLDFTATTGIPSDVNWNASSRNKNAVFYVQSGILSGKTNVVSGTTSAKLELVDGSGNFYVPVNFSATSASYRSSINGRRMLVLPFEATIPTGVKAYNLEVAGGEVVGKTIKGKIPANTPVLVVGSGDFVFEGSGSVSSPRNLQVGITNGVYLATKAPVGSYYLEPNGNGLAFQRISSGAQPSVNPFGGYLTPGAGIFAASLPLKLEEEAVEQPVTLASFSATLEGSAVKLSWSTNSESNNPGFDIERSADGNTFAKIASVSSKGNSTTEQSYTFQDPSPLTGNNHYRLKYTDANGGPKYSEIRVVAIAEPEQPVVAFKLYPVPTEGALTIMTGNESGNLFIYDIAGRLMMTIPVKKSETVQTDVSSLASGIYYYRLNGVKGALVKR